MEEGKIRESLKTIVLSDLFFYVLEMIKSTRTKTFADTEKHQREVTKHGEDFIKNLTKLINYEKKHESI